MIVKKSYQLKNIPTIEDVIKYLLDPFLDISESNNINGNLISNILDLILGILIFEYKTNRHLFLSLIIKEIIYDENVSDEIKKESIQRIIKITAYKKYQKEINDNFDYYYEKILTNEKIKCSFKLINNNIRLGINKILIDYDFSDQVYHNYKFLNSYYYFYKFISNSQKTFVQDINIFEMKYKFINLYYQNIIDFLDYLSTFNCLKVENLNKLYNIFINNVRFKYYNYFSPPCISFNTKTPPIISIGNIQTINTLIELTQNQKVWNKLNETNIFYTKINS